MSEFLSITYTASLPVILGYIVWLLKEERKDRKANTSGVKEILGYMIDRWHEEYILQGYITTHQFNQFKSVYDAYHENGGNGAREEKWHHIQKLQIDDTKSSISPFLQFYFEQQKKQQTDK